LRWPYTYYLHSVTKITAYVELKLILDNQNFTVFLISKYNSHLSQRFIYTYIPSSQTLKPLMQYQNKKINYKRLCNCDIINNTAIHESTAVTLTWSTKSSLPFSQVIIYDQSYLHERVLTPHDDIITSTASFVLCSVSKTAMARTALFCSE